MPPRQTPATRNANSSPRGALVPSRGSGSVQPYNGPSALGIPAKPTPRLANGQLARAPEYGELDPSDEVHDEIKEMGREVRNIISQHLPRHGTSQQQVMAGIRQFGPSKQSKKILNKENEAARLALETGVYAVWRCMEKPKLSGGNQDFCCRIGYRHRCFCGHPLAQHAKPNLGPKQRQISPCEAQGCACRGFAYVPNEPEEIGEGWLTRRANFNPKTWSAKCRCGHGHKEHDPGSTSCNACGCGRFNSHFLCVVCDRSWEDHATVFESESARLKAGQPTGVDYFPLADVDWDVRELVLKDPTGGGALQAPASYKYVKDNPGQTLRSGAVVEELPDDANGSSGMLAIKGKSTRSSLPSIGGDAGSGVGNYCPHCASIYKDTSKFCKKCGKPRRSR